MRSITHIIMVYEWRRPSSHPCRWATRFHQIHVYTMYPIISNTMPPTHFPFSLVGMRAHVFYDPHLSARRASRRLSKERGRAGARFVSAISAHSTTIVKLKKGKLFRLCVRRTTCRIVCVCMVRSTTKNMHTHTQFRQRLCSFYWFT